MISLLLASTLGGLPPSEAVLTAYHMACNVGELRLDPSEATIFDGKKRSTPFSLSVQWGVPETLTYISLKYPPSTNIVLATYKPKYAQQMARVCQVASNAITREDAERGFLSAVEKPNMTRSLRPGVGNVFEIDRPKEGFRKRLIFYDAGWVIMETGLYKAAH